MYSFAISAGLATDKFLAYSLFRMGQDCSLEPSRNQKTPKDLISDQKLPNIYTRRRRGGPPHVRVGNEHCNLIDVDDPPGRLGPAALQQLQ